MKAVPPKTDLTEALRTALDPLLRPIVLEAVRSALPDLRPADEPERLRAKKELAAHLGVTTKTVDVMTAEGMPHVIVGTHRRYRVSDVEAYLETRRPTPKKTEQVDPLAALGIKLVGAR